MIWNHRKDLRVSAAYVAGHQILFVVVVTVVVTAASSPLGSTSHCTCGWASDGVEAVRAGNSSRVGRRRVGATATAASARRGHAIRREFTSAYISEGWPGDADTIGRCVRAGGGGGGEGRRRVGVVTDGSCEAEAVGGTRNYK
jgi:hypothetical protein